MIEGLVFKRGSFPHRTENRSPIDSRRVGMKNSDSVFPSTNTHLTTQS